MIRSEELVIGKLEIGKKSRLKRFDEWFDRWEQVILAVTLFMFALTNIVHGLNLYYHSQEIDLLKEKIELIEKNNE